MGVAMAEYQLEIESGLINPPPYPAHDLSRIDPPPVREADDEDFVDDFRSASFTRQCVLFDRYLQRDQKRVQAMAMLLQQEEQ